MNTRDVAIAYRIYPKLAKNAFVLPEWTKLDLVRVCLLSLLEALRKIDYSFYCILDGCPNEYAALCAQFIPADRLVLVETPGIGNNATFLKQIELLLGQEESNTVFFAEDDYFYLPGRFAYMLDLCSRQEVDFITPYDHLDYYQRRSHDSEPNHLAGLHNYQSEIIWSGIHWRTVSSTTCTFLTTKKVLRKTAKYLNLYPLLGDYGMWLSITKKRRVHFHVSKTILMYALALRQMVIGKAYRLWSPMPSIATHMVDSHLAPGTEWKSLIKKYSSALR